jgi:hypothetical protein
LLRSSYISPDYLSFVLVFCLLLIGSPLSSLDWGTPAISELALLNVASHVRDWPFLNEIAGVTLE